MQTAIFFVVSSCLSHVASSYISLVGVGTIVRRTCSNESHYLIVLEIESEMEGMWIVLSCSEDLKFILLLQLITTSLSYCNVVFPSLQAELRGSLLNVGVESEK